MDSLDQHSVPVEPDVGEGREEHGDEREEDVDHVERGEGGAVVDDVEGVVHRGEL